FGSVALQLGMSCSLHDLPGHLAAGASRTASVRCLQTTGGESFSLLVLESAQLDNATIMVLASGAASSAASSSSSSSSQSSSPSLAESLSVTPASRDFGQVNLGTESTASFTLQN